MSAALVSPIPYNQPGYDRTARYPGLMPRCRPYGPNVYDDCLDSEYAAWVKMLANGGLRACCPQGRRKYTTPPWVSMPSEGRTFQPIGIQPLTAFQTLGVFNGLDTVVLQMRVPLGYDGVISDIVCLFTGSGFDEGSGDITWRLAADYLLDSTGAIPTARYLRDLGNITTTLGSLTQPSPIPRGGFRVFSNDLVTFWASIAATATVANGNVITRVKGWIYPR